MLVAEGAVDFAAEPELELYDMAALDVIVREAGGRFTSLDGRDGPMGGNALASNGMLHETVLGFLGSVGPDARPGPDGRHQDDPGRAPAAARPTARRPTAPTTRDPAGRRGLDAPRHPPVRRRASGPDRRHAAPAQRPPSCGAERTGSGPASDVTGGRLPPRDR